MSSNALPEKSATEQIEAWRQRIAALSGRRSKSPSHIEELRSAVVAALEQAADGLLIQPGPLLEAVENYDRAKGGPHDR